MKNRMRESRSFGSVRGEGGNVLAYSENRSCSVVLRRANRNGASVDKLLNIKLILSGAASS
jgi:hypothetical protein